MGNNELFILKEGKVILPANQWFAERIIGDYDEANQDTKLNELRLQFNAFTNDLEKIEADLQQDGEILKCAGRINRSRNSLMKAKAIGDYETAFTRLDAWEELLRQRTEAVIAEKELICSELETLTQAPDLKQATEQLATLQKKYKALPVSVPDIRNEAFADRIEKAVTAFFALKQAKHDEFGKELLDNLSKKMDLCEQAEKLKDSTEWKKTTDALLAMMEEWKTIGPVAKHRSEEIWLRFNEARDHFFKRKKEHVKEIKSEQEANLIEKEALVTKAEALRESKDWKKTTVLFNELMDEWKKTGRVAQEKSDAIWQRFLDAKNHFFSRKDAHFSSIRTEQENNYTRKLAIVERAEELINTSDFDGATQEFSDLMDDWKTIGWVPKEQGDALWDRFIQAKKKFFERKDAWRDERRQTMAAGLQERIQRNRSFLNKINRDLHREEDLLFDLDDRLANLPATLRSYEKREELNETKEEVTQHVNELRKKVQEVKQKLQADEREMSFIMRPPKKKTDQPNATESASETHQETLITEPTTTSPSNVSENNEATDNHLPEETTQESPL
jgi:hypothetical protein